MDPERDNTRPPPADGQGFIFIPTDRPMIPPPPPTPEVSSILATIARVCTDAKAGRTSWANVALHEIALLGMIRYRTWLFLTDDERNEVGVMSRTKARQSLGLPVVRIG